MQATTNTLNEESAHGANPKEVELQSWEGKKLDPGEIV